MRVRYPQGLLDVPVPAAAAGQGNDQQPHVSACENMENEEVNDAARVPSQKPVLCRGIC